MTRYLAIPLLSLLLTAILLLSSCRKDSLFRLIINVEDNWRLLHAEEIASGNTYEPTFNRLILNKIRYELLKGSTSISEGGSGIGMGISELDTLRFINFTPRSGAPIIFEDGLKNLYLIGSDTLLLEDTEGFRYRYTFVRE